MRSGDVATLTQRLRAALARQARAREDLVAGRADEVAALAELRRLGLTWWSVPGPRPVNPALARGEATIGDGLVEAVVTLDSHGIVGRQVAISQQPPSTTLDAQALE